MAGKDKDTAKVTKRTLTSKDDYLDEALRSLEEIDAGRHKDSDSYGKVIDALTKLHAATDSFYDAPVGSEAARKQIYAAYESVREMCDAYLEKNKGFRFTSYGRQRQKSVQAIRDIIGRDMYILHSDHPEFSTKKNLKELLETARKSTVIIDDPASVKSVGGSVSTRIPVSIRGEETEEKGFFTARQKSEDEDEIVARISDRFKEKNGLREVFEGYDEDSRKAMIKGVYSAMILPSTVEKYYKITQEDCPATAEEFYGSYEETLKRVFQDENGDPMSKDEIVKILQDEEVRENLHSFFRETYRGFRGYDFSHNKAGIQDGAEIATRNVAAYRLAARLGMADVIAKAETMDLRVGDRSMSGVFMQTAKGEDLARLSELSGMRDIVQSRQAMAEGMDTARAKRQLCDLQILDYLCGNIDRHAKNFIYQTSVGDDGKTRVTGVVGIDNDMSFGTKTAGFPDAVVPPDELRAVSAATYQTITQMNPAELKTLLGDLGLGDQEIAAAQTRLQILKTSLISRAHSFDPTTPAEQQFAEAQRNGQVFVFNDEMDFDSVPFASFAAASGNNYFRKMMDAPEAVMAGTESVAKGKERVETALKGLEQEFLNAPYRWWSRGSERKLDEWYDTRRSEIQMGFPAKAIPYAEAHRHEPFASFFAKLKSGKVRRSVDELDKAEKASRKASTSASARSAGAAKHKQQRKSGAKTSAGPAGKNMSDQ